MYKLRISWLECSLCRARSAGLTAAQVELARLEAHTVAWDLVPEGTLHMVKAADARWLIPLLGRS